MYNYMFVYAGRHVHLQVCVSQNLQATFFILNYRSIYVSVWLAIISIDQNNRSIYVPHRRPAIFL